MTSQLNTKLDQSKRYNKNNKYSLRNQKDDTQGYGYDGMAKSESEDEDDDEVIRLKNTT